MKAKAMSEEQRRLDLVSKAISRGVFGGLLKAFGFLGVCLVITASYLSWMNDLDSTDGEVRSGLKPHVDALTGCEYLSVPSGSVTPRMGGDGVQLGCQ